MSWYRLMDYYVIVIPFLSIISAIGVIFVLKTHFSIQIVKKLKFKISDYILLLLFFIGIYLYIPNALHLKGVIYNDISSLEKAAKLSIFPYEKATCYEYISFIYEHYNKDGEKCIEYREKAINGKYKKYPELTTMLALMYSIKGDYDKVIELSKILPERKSIPRMVYIQKDEYQKALDTYDKDDNKNPHTIFLKAALYRELGNTKEADRLYKLAEQQMSQDSKSDYSNIESFKSIEAYKKHMKSEKKAYNFK